MSDEEVIVGERFLREVSRRRGKVLSQHNLNKLIALLNEKVNNFYLSIGSENLSKHKINKLPHVLYRGGRSVIYPPFWIILPAAPLMVLFTWF